MERWVTIALVVMLVIIGMFVVRSIVDGQSSIDVEITQSLECRIANGVCVEQCQGQILDVSCGEAGVCCQTIT